MLAERSQISELSITLGQMTDAPSDDWELIYCKGPVGEKLEFVKALGPVKQRFSITIV